VELTTENRAVGGSSPPLGTSHREQNARTHLIFPFPSPFCGFEILMLRRLIFDSLGGGLSASVQCFGAQRSATISTSNVILY
ncbi:MAG: hypothetical protein ACRDHN_05000, partial [Thermomicrobiales bacterium]